MYYIYLSFLILLKRLTQMFRSFLLLPHSSAVLFPPNSYLSIDLTIVSMDSFAYDRIMRKLKDFRYVNSN